MPREQIIFRAPRPLAAAYWLVLLLLSLQARPAMAQPAAPTTAPAVHPALTPDSLRQPVIWDPAWPRFSIAEWIVSGVGAAITLSAQVVPPRADPWQGGVVADEAVRDAIRLGDLPDRRRARDASDIFLTALTAYPFLVDAMLVTAWYRNSPDVALQMALINAEVMAVTLGLQGLSLLISNRERPYGRDCGGVLPAESRDCNSSRRYHSFFSGHTSQAFASAGLICSHHLHLKLYGGGWPDVVPCVAGFAMATSTGLLRMMGDQHYLSDVLTGAAVGTLVGLGLPWLLHYRHGPGRARAGEQQRATFQLVPMGAGVGMVGRF